MRILDLLLALCLGPVTSPGTLLFALSLSGLGKVDLDLLSLDFCVVQLLLCSLRILHVGECDETVALGFASFFIQHDERILDWV